MQSILDAINEWIKEILIGAINGNLSTMFGDVNEKVGTIANEVGQTPQGWNANIFSMIQTLSENVIVPIAGLVITYVLCYELISMVTEKNNMHDIDTFMFFKWIFKAFVAVFIVTNTFNITMAVFDMAQHIVSGAAGVIGGDTNIDVALFGLHQNIVLLGCCLAILPYLFGALYLQKSHKQCQLWLAALAILIPSVVEKAAIYLFGAYLYNLRPINVVGVMEAIKSNAPYTNFIKNQSAQNLINLSYFNWTYILCSIAISVLVILLLHKTKQKSNKG